MQIIVSRCQIFLTSSLVALLTVGSVFAQTADPAPETETTNEDEVIAFGTQILGEHEGMDAFFRGDFETAEIEFENEFKSLRRFESAKENSARDAEISIDRAAQTADAGANLSSSVNSRSGGAPVLSSGSALSTNPGLTSNFINRRSEGRTVLTDGKVTYEDFAFASYMTGLSEIQLGKYDEAKDSLKTSLHHDEKNYDARMRLGLLYLKERDFEKAADHLEKLNKLRRKCEKRSCEDAADIREATLTLAQQITSLAQSN